MATRTTPNGQRHALTATNTRSHSVRTNQRDDDDRPAAPAFLDEYQFLNALGTGGGALAGPSNSAARSHSMQATRVDGSAVNRLLAQATANSRKRAAADVIDHEGSNSPDAAAPQAKKSRATTTVGQPVDGNVKRKTSKRGAAAEKEKMQQETAQWRAKYKKAFPSFTFYFDAIDEATKAMLSKEVRKLGAAVDNFFSKKVTHVVTTRSVPSAVNKENVDSPAPRGNGPYDSAAGKTKKQSLRSPKMYSLMNGQKLRTMTGDLDKNPFIDSQDILSKALDFGLKIWQCDKLQLILSRINSHSPNKLEQARNPSLPSLLRDEQLYGTRERDPFVPRNDMHYFSQNKYYLLVEDSTGEHRPIVVKEYERPRKHEDPRWPVLWGGIEGRTGFYHYEGEEIVYERKQPPPAPLPVDAKPAARPTANLRRAISLQNVARGAQVTGAVGQPGYHRHDSYIAASGNSQIITSNIASATSTAARSGAAAASRFAPGQGPFVDKRLAVLSNRTVSVAGGALLGSGASIASGSGASASGVSAGGRVAALKRQGKLQRSLSVDAGLSGRRVHAVPARQEPKKPGYCENCRLKYDDFKEHIVTSKHRRFALNQKNWVELDSLLAQIKRPLRKTTVHMNDLVLQGGAAADASPSSDGEHSIVEDSGFYEVPAISCDERDEEDRTGSEDDSAEDDEAESEEDSPPLIVDDEESEVGSPPVLEESEEEYI
ncbi:hypothetical protein JCM10213_007433 [Rhodosporidiobolus nylandii]